MLCIEFKNTTLFLIADFSKDNISNINVKIETSSQSHIAVLNLDNKSLV